MNLASQGTFRIGGEAPRWYRLRDERDLDWVQEEQVIDPLVIGEGSNILFPDEPLKRPVIRVKNETVAVDGEEFVVSAGLDLHAFILPCLLHGFGGMETLSGIPGTIGGAVRGNAGAYGAEIGPLVDRVRIYDTSSLPWKVKELSQEEMQFRYRGSVLVEHPEWLVWQVVIRLHRDTPPEELLRKRFETIATRRRVLPWERSAGSFFKNLIAENLPAEARRSLEKLGVTETHGKIAVGAIVDTLGLKGMRIGNACVSPAHGNYLINIGGASASDVRALAWTVMDRVREAIGIVLEPEVQILGADGRRIPLDACQRDALSRTPSMV